MNSRPAAAALLSLTLAAGCDAAPPAAPPLAGPSPQSLPTTVVTINGTAFTLQVADDDKEREIGLMHVKSLPADGGMVFVFPGERMLGFWMRNTPIDLDIIYADHAGRVTAVKTMRAYDERNVSSDEPATFAIELKAGTAAKLGAKAGQTIALPADLTKNVR